MRYGACFVFPGGSSRTKNSWRSSPPSLPRLSPVHSAFVERRDMKLTGLFVRSFRYHIHNNALLYKRKSRRQKVPGWGLIRAISERGRQSTLRAVRMLAQSGPRPKATGRKLGEIMTMRTTNKPKPADQMLATFIREGGNGNVQTLLGLSILATFLKRGEKLAHMMGINTPSTRPAGTKTTQQNKIRAIR